MGKYYLLFIGIVVLFLLLSNNFIFAQAKSTELQSSETFKEAESLGTRILTGISRALKKIWQESVEIWKSALGRILNIWNKYIKPPLINFWDSFFNKEVNIKSPEVQQEFEKEKQEIKQEIKTEVPKVSKNIWERFKEIIKWWND